jgi:hypothetical protein
MVGAMSRLWRWMHFASIILTIGLPNMVSLWPAVRQRAATLVQTCCGNLTDIISLPSIQETMNVEESESHSGRA